MKWGRAAAVVLAAGLLGTAGYRIVAHKSRPAPVPNDSSRVSRWLAEPDLGVFLADFAPGPLPRDDRARVERDLARVEAARARLAADPAAFPATGGLACRKLLDRAARDLCILGRTRRALDLLAEARSSARGEERLRLAHLAAAVDELVHKGPSPR